MRTTAALAALPILAVLGAAAAAPPALAGEDAQSTVSEYCASRGDLGLSHGACVAYFQTRNVVPHDATVCQDAGIRRSLGVSNHGQCVRRLAEMRGEHR